MYPLPYFCGSVDKTDMFSKQEANLQPEKIKMECMVEYSRKSSILNCLTIILKNQSLLPTTHLLESSFGHKTSIRKGVSLHHNNAPPHTAQLTKDQGEARSSAEKKSFILHLFPILLLLIIICLPV